MTGRRKPVKPLVLALMQPGVGYTSTGIAKAVGTTRDVVAQCLRRLIAAQQVWSLVVGRDHLYFSSERGRADFSAEAAAEFAEQQRAARIASNSRITNARAAKAARRYAVVKPRPGRPAGVVLAPKPAPVEPDLTGLPVTRAAVSGITQPWRLLKLPPDPRFPSLAGMGIGRYDDSRGAA